jgi:steroid delta-isomerase-like uncharacterized protein
MKFRRGALGASACSLDSLEAFARQLNTESTRPNIVCIVGDGLRRDEFSSAGQKLLHTPNMDRIAREGCTFRNAFVVNALCLLSRATMLTGMYSHTTGAVSNVEGKIPARFPLVSDLSAALATFKHPKYDVPALGGVVDGAEGVDGLLHALLAAYPDFWLREGAYYHSEDAVIMECVFGGTQQGEWAGLPATGRKMQVAAALFFLFDGDGLICERVYFDHATVLRQLGAID